MAMLPMSRGQLAEEKHLQFSFLSMESNMSRSRKPGLCFQLRICHYLHLFKAPWPIPHHPKQVCSKELEPPSEAHSSNSKLNIEVPQNDDKAGIVQEVKKAQSQPKSSDTAFSVRADAEDPGRQAGGGVESRAFTLAMRSGWSQTALLQQHHDL